MLHDDPEGLIINLSSKYFSVYDFKVLNKGLNFCPTPGLYNITEFNNDFKNFSRKIKLKSHFGTSNMTTNETNDDFKPDTDKTWEPQYTHHTVKTFLEALDNDLSQIQTNDNTFVRNNLSKLERESLKKLKTMDDIIITKADKGGATVIIDIEDYIKEAERQLNDVNSYKKLDNDPTLVYNDIVNEAIDTLQNKNLIRKKVADSLKITHPTTPKFHTLPKIHKPDNPGRPVVNSIDSHTSKISKFVDFYLQPLAQRLPSYIKDTSHFLRKLNSRKNINQNDILVTLDVKSLYTNIPNDEGITAAKNAIERSPDSKASVKVITTFLWLILTLSNFVFNGINYLQKMGVTMGSNCSPSYANLFMGEFEAQHLYPLLRGKCKLYTRYIDDIFFIWNGTENELLEFFRNINGIHRTIKFEPNYSTSEINFLDTVVYKNQSGILQTKLYQKPTDRTNLLHFKSAHPTATKTSIIYSQALRIKRICSEEHEMRHQFNVLKSKLLKRGYDSITIDLQIAKTNLVKREQLLMETTKELIEPKVPFITTFNKSLPNIRDKIDSHWDKLQINPKIKDIFRNKPVVAYRRNRNIHDIVGGKTVVNDKVIRNVVAKGHSSPCKRGHGSKCCKQIMHTTTFTSHKTGRIYHIREKMNCKDSWLIYLCSCKKCNIQYTGKTEWPFNVRLNKYRFDIGAEETQLIIRHFKQSDHDFERDMKFTLIEKLNNLEGDKETKRLRLKKRENFWIKELQTLYPSGLNEYLNRV